MGFWGDFVFFLKKVAKNVAELKKSSTFALAI
jgi:hypothetical protein